MRLSQPCIVHRVSELRHPTLAWVNSFLLLHERLVLQRNPMASLHQFPKSAGTRLQHLSDRAVEEKGAVVIRVVLQDGHDEYKPLEIFKAQNSFWCEVPVWSARELVNIGENDFR